MNITELLKHRAYTYFEFLKYLASRLLNTGRKTGHNRNDRENNYWGYISSLNDEKRKRCHHPSLRKVSGTKFYCQDCGAELRYIREDISLLSELFTVAIAGFFIYHLVKRLKSSPQNR